MSTTLERHRPPLATVFLSRDLADRLMQTRRRIAVRLFNRLVRRGDSYREALWHVGCRMAAFDRRIGL